MHFITTFIAAALAVSTVSAQATPGFNQTEIDDYCNSPGQPCNLLKRAADAVADANAFAWAEPTAEPRRHWCYIRGQGCSKAKRSAVAMAEAVAEAYAEAMPEAGKFEDITFEGTIGLLTLLQKPGDIGVTYVARAAPRPSATPSQRPKLWLRLMPADTTGATHVGKVDPKPSSMLSRLPKPCPMRMLKPADTTGATPVVKVAPRPSALPRPSRRLSQRRTLRPMPGSIGATCAARAAPKRNARQTQENIGALCVVKGAPRQRGLWTFWQRRFKTSISTKSRLSAIPGISITLFAFGQQSFLLDLL